MSAVDLNKVMFMKVACLAYAHSCGITIPPKAKDSTIADIVKSFVLDKIQERIIKGADYQPFQCEDCESKILNEDTYCWKCGSDVTVDNTGGFKDKSADAKKPVDKKKESPKDKPADVKKPTDKKKESPKDKRPVQNEISKGGKTRLVELIPDGQATPVDLADLPTPATDGTLNRSIEDRVTNIRRHIGNTGISAYEVGMELFQIQAENLYLAAGYSNLEEFLGKEVGMSRSTAFQFIRIAENVDQADCRLLGVAKLQIIASAKDLPTVVQKKLLKAAKPSEEGGLNYSREKLTDMVRQEKAKEREKKSGVGSPTNTGGRPQKSKISPLKAFVGERFVIRIKDGESKLQQLDDYVGLHIKRTKTQITGEWVELEESSEG